MRQELAIINGTGAGPALEADPITGTSPKSPSGHTNACAYARPGSRLGRRRLRSDRRPGPRDSLVPLVAADFDCARSCSAFCATGDWNLPGLPRPTVCFCACRSWSSLRDTTGGGGQNFLRMPNSRTFHGAAVRPVNQHTIVGRSTILANILSCHRILLISKGIGLLTSAVAALGRILPLPLHHRWVVKLSRKERKF